MVLGQIRRRMVGRGERGAVAVVVAVLMLVMVAGAALVVDLGLARDSRRQSQNASDAAALAAGNTLYLTGATNIPGAVAAAKSYMEQNFGVTSDRWASCRDADHLAVTATDTECISFDNSSAPNKIRVVAPTEEVQTIFGGAVGREKIPVGSLAEVQLGTTVKCSLCFLGSVDAGNGDFSVNGGSIAVNGNVTAGPLSIWTSMYNGIVGTHAGGVFNPAPGTIPPFSDPLASTLALPLDTSSLSARSNPCASAASGGGPGLYSSFSLPNSACDLEPGLYVISGTWDMKNNTRLRGNGVTLYVRSPSGYLNFKNGEVDLQAPNTGPLAGYAVIYDRDNTNPLTLQGNGGTGIRGVTYAPKSKLDFNGNSCFGFVGGPVIVDGVIKANGNKSCVTVTSPVDTTVTRTRMHLAR